MRVFDSNGPVVSLLKLYAETSIPWLEVETSSYLPVADLGDLDRLGHIASLHLPI